MKWFALLSLTLVSSAASADAAEDQIRSALSSLRSQPHFRIDLVGTETYDGKTKKIETRFWWNTVTNAKGESERKLECVEWIDGVRKKRTVGDGTTLWSLDAVQNRYTIATYGSRSGTQPSNYLRALALGFNAGATGQTQYLARLLTQLYAGAEVTYTPWVKSTVKDEFTEVLVYDSYVSYRFGDPIYKYLRFTMSPDEWGNFHMSSFDLLDTVKIGGKERAVEWIASINLVEEPAAELFVFTPPAGAQPLVKSRAGR